MKKPALDLLATGALEFGIELTQEQLGRFSALGDLLGKWNRKINLTSITDEAEVSLKHFVDSLTLLRVVTGEGLLLDIGSGGGFPALPLKIVCPQLQVVSVDSVEKKIIFQRNAARQLGLEGFSALHARVEEMQAYEGRFDWIVSRAFSDLGTFLRVSVPLLSPEGTVIAMKGSGGPDEVEAAGEVPSSLGLRLMGIEEFSLPVVKDLRSLVVLKRACI